jgi:hypothetical protein
MSALAAAVSALSAAMPGIAAAARELAGARTALRSRAISIVAAVLIIVCKISNYLVIRRLLPRPSCMEKNYSILINAFLVS